MKRANALAQSRKAAKNGEVLIISLSVLSILPRDGVQHDGY